jgi:glucose/arabinose dehydrogenase
MEDRMASRIRFHTGQRHRAAALATVSLFAIALMLAQPAVAQSSSQGTQANTCTGDNTGITLSPGFCATVFADNIGHVRHMVVAPNGALYVNTWSGRYYHNDTPPAGGFLVAAQGHEGRRPRRCD